MYNIGQWDPLRDLDAFFSRSPLRNSKKSDEWVPSVDIVEDDKEFLLKAEMPEVRKEDIKMNVEDGVLSFSGERRIERIEEGKKFHRVERSYGSFARSFALPENIKASAISAEFKDGLLKIHLPKEEAARPKSIDIKVG